MSSDEKPYDRQVSVSSLREWTAEDIAEKADPRCCDCCGKTQILGCAVALRLGFEYREACAACATKILAGLQSALGEGASG